MERIYRAFKLKQERDQMAPSAGQRRRRAGSAKGLFQVPPDFDAPLDDFAEYQ